MITEYTPGCQLPSAGSRPLRVPRHNLERYGRRGYSVTAPPCGTIYRTVCA